ncbi:galactokinase [Flavobacterium crassostreae]|uniref:Galactokinase n=1 Tax=Flavobacterium crassostreae TaxID=1763534 RepID=A0A1B9DX78_9FLAO|nr:galactokinase [Flavobacterium crassostreae]OCB74290.1 galactokinase [Flavobacterium crassostreae]
MQTTDLITKTKNHFENTFNSKVEKMVLSPGRINILGEHIDYNDGFVLPAAIDKIICFAFEKNNSQKCKIIALDLDEEFEIDLTQEVQLEATVWTNYFRGIIQLLKSNGFVLEGFNCVFSSNIPVGSGLSSSAALECGFLFGINELFGLNIKPLDIALMGQKAEHWVGIHCGIMDQFASVMGRKDKVIKLDCTTLEYTYHDADFKDYVLVLFDSNVKHALMTSAYNQRRQECEEGLAIIKNHFAAVHTFRDCTLEQLLSLKTKMPEPVYKRCFFVIKEIDRVNKACEALDTGAITTLGELLFATHEGLSKEYEVSCDELDFLVATVKKNPAVVGARVMGGGFGGCTLNLIKKGSQDKIKEELSKAYLDQFGIELKIYDVKIGNGTSLHEL